MITGEWYSPVAEVDKSDTSAMKKDLPSDTCLELRLVRIHSPVQKLPVCEKHRFQAAGNAVGVSQRNCCSIWFKSLMRSSEERVRYRNILVEAGTGDG